MQAMQLKQAGQPLSFVDLPDPEPASDEVRVRVSCCGVCRTDLHVVDGELPDQRLPIIPGHEIVGVVDEVGRGVANLQRGMRVGIPWLGSTCGVCQFCRQGRENLCDRPQFTGYTRDGGYATHVVADSRFVFALPESGDDIATAPLLCAGLIGWRSLRMAGDGRRIGLYGFGAAAHIIAQVARWQGREVFAFTRPGDAAGQRFASALGAAWVGDSDQAPPERLDCAIIFAPVGALVPAALKGRAERRPCRLRGYSHERYPGFSVPVAVGGAADRFGRQPDPARCGRVLRHRSAGWNHDTNAALSVAASERGVVGPSCRAPRRSGGAGALILGHGRTRPCTRRRAGVLRVLRPLDGAQVGDDGARIGAREAEARHVGVRALQARPKPVHELVEVDAIVEPAKCRRAGMRARAGPADRVTFAA